MDNHAQVREFLQTRRARISPEDVGLPGGGNRRVPGLRRGEVALLADVSIEYYSRLERGNLGGVSDAVLDALGRALRLDDAERAHLSDLAASANFSPARARRRPSSVLVRPGVQRTLDAITEGPAFVRNGRMDMLAVNPLGRALYDHMFTSAGGAMPNHGRFVFLDPNSHDFYPDWGRAADDIVAILRTEAGRDPFNPSLTELVGELSTRSEHFRTRWAAHNVRQHYTGKKHFHHHIVGDVHLTYEAMDLNADQGLNLLIYTAEPGSPTADALRLLGTWKATADTADTALRAPVE